MADIYSQPNLTRSLPKGFSLMPLLLKNKLVHLDGFNRFLDTLYRLAVEFGMLDLFFVFNVKLNSSSRGDKQFKFEFLRDLIIDLVDQSLMDDCLYDCLRNLTSIHEILEHLYTILTGKKGRSKISLTYHASELLPKLNKLELDIFKDHWAVFKQKEEHPMAIGDKVRRARFNELFVENEDNYQIDFSKLLSFYEVYYENMLNEDNFVSDSSFNTSFTFDLSNDSGNKVESTSDLLDSQRSIFEVKNIKNQYLKVDQLTPDLYTHNYLLNFLIQLSSIKDSNYSLSNQHLDPFKFNSILKDQRALIRTTANQLEIAYDVMKKLPVNEQKTILSSLNHLQQTSYVFSQLQNQSIESITIQLINVQVQINNIILQSLNVLPLLMPYYLHLTEFAIYCLRQNLLNQELISFLPPTQQLLAAEILDSQKNLPNLDLYMSRLNDKDNEFALNYMNQYLTKLNLASEVARLRTFFQTNYTTSQSQTVPDSTVNTDSMLNQLDQFDCSNIHLISDYLSSEISQYLHKSSNKVFSYSNQQILALRQFECTQNLAPSHYSNLYSNLCQMTPKIQESTTTQIKANKSKKKSKNSKDSNKTSASVELGSNAKNEPM